MTTPDTDQSTTAPSGAEPARAGILSRATYAEGGGSWGADTLEALRKSRRLAWIIAGCAGGVALVQAIAIAVLTPLKQPVPYTITVDRDTGYVATARGVNLGPLSEQEAVTQSFLVQYVLARETFDVADYRENYRKTLLWSQGGAEADYLRDWDRANPNSVHSRYRPTTRVSVTVKSVAVLGPTSALVRFDTEQTEGPNSGGGQRTPYAAVITWSMSGRPISDRDRYLNPLGFQVSAYRRDQESTGSFTLPAAPMPAPMAPPSPPQMPEQATGGVPGAVSTPGAAMPGIPAAVGGTTAPGAAASAQSPPAASSPSTAASPPPPTGAPATEPPPVREEFPNQ